MLLEIVCSPAEETSVKLSLVWLKRFQHHPSQGRWQMVILPQLEGGLGIIDPELQSQALLGKLVIHGLTHGRQTWKLLLQQGLRPCTPQRGGD